MLSSFFRCLICFLALALGSNQSYAGEDKRKGNRAPPQEAIDACLDRQEGEEVYFVTPRGHEVTGTCQFKGDVLAAKPEHRHGRHSEAD